MKKIIFFLIIISIISAVVYTLYFKEKEPEFELVKVVRGNVIQEVSETGQVKKGEEVNLSFNSPGIIEKIYVEVGEKVKKGDILAKLENSKLKIQLKEAKASLELAQAQLNKLLKGATQEEIQIAQTNVDNAKIALEAAKRNLEDIKIQGEENLKAAYEDALNILDDAKLKIFNAFNTADFIQTNYFFAKDQEGNKVRESKTEIQNALNHAKSYLDIAKETGSYDDIDTALSEMNNALNTTFDALEVIRNMCGTPSYKNVVSATDKSSLDTHKGYINTALTNVVNTQQAISSTKLTNTININTYQAQVDSAEGQVKAAEDELARVLAPPTQEDIDLYQAQVKQAEAEIQLLEKSIEDTILKSPFDGQVVRIENEEGEIIQTALKDTIITLLPDDPFKIEVDIYEEDVAKMKIGDPVEISLVAFPDKVLKGRVVSIDPAEKMIEGVVYYEVSINFETSTQSVFGGEEGFKDKIRPGMTADVVIKTASKENVLVVPDTAIIERDNRYIVKVLKGEQIEEREIKIGLEGSNNLVEVVSGLKEGEEVVVE